MAFPKRIRCRTTPSQRRLRSAQLRQVTLRAILGTTVVIVKSQAKRLLALRDVNRWNCPGTTKHCQGVNADVSKPPAANTVFEPFKHDESCNIRALKQLKCCDGTILVDADPIHGDSPADIRHRRRRHQGDSACFYLKHRQRSSGSGLGLRGRGENTDKSTKR